MSTAAGLVALTSTSTSVKIADQLRERIIDGYFAPGQQINESLISSQLNVSRGPVREALQRLSQEGLLVSKPNRGVFVVELTAEDVDEIYAAREILELGAAQVIADQPAEQRKKVSEKLKKIAVALTKAASKNDWETVVRLDLEFHTAMVSASGNSRLLRAYTTLATETLICMRHVEQAYPAAESVTNHVMLADLIEEGSMAEIRSVLHRHLTA